MTWTLGEVALGYVGLAAAQVAFFERRYRHAWREVVEGMRPVEQGEGAFRRSTILEPYAYKRAPALVLAAALAGFLLGQQGALALVAVVAAAVTERGWGAGDAIGLVVILAWAWGSLRFSRAARLLLRRRHAGPAFRVAAIMVSLFFGLMCMVPLSAVLRGEDPVAGAAWAVVPLTVTIAAGLMLLALDRYERLLVLEGRPDVP